MVQVISAAAWKTVTDTKESRDEQAGDESDEKQTTGAE